MPKPKNVEGRIIISTQLTYALARWLDLQVGKLRLKHLGSNELPTRSSYMRSLLERDQAKHNNA